MTSRQILDKPGTEHIGNLYRFSWPGIQIELDRLTEHRGALTGELTVRSSLPGAEGLLHSSQLNINSAVTRKGVVKALAEREDSIDWGGVLESVCFQCREMYRKGEPLIDLRTVQRIPEQWLMYPYAEYGGPTLLVGASTSGKSVLALWIALHAGLGAPLAPGHGTGKPTKPMYLDWETSKDVHNQRLLAIGAGMGIEPEALPPIFYRRMSASLPASAQNLQQEIADNQIGFVVIDSLGMAGDGPPEESQTIIQEFQAIRMMDVPTLVIHHKNKNTGIKRADRDRVFGSVYAINAPRIIWDMTNSEDEDSSGINAALICLKTSNGRLLKRHGMTIAFENDEHDELRAVRFTRRALADMPEHADKAGLKERILIELQDGMKSSQQLTEALDTTHATVKGALTDLRKRGVVLRIAENQWGRAASVQE